MKRILFLGAPVFQIPIVKKAKEMGLYVGIIDINKNAPAFPYADEHFVCSIRDKEAVLEIAKQFNPSGIMMGACDTSVVTGAYVCNILGLPGNKSETAIKATDKVRMLEAFEMNNVAHPFYRIVKKTEIDSVSSSFPYPVILKPIDSAGGRGICIVHNDEELKNGAKFSSEAGLSGDILIEEYMEGPEVSVEVLVVNCVPYILQITDKITSGEPHFFEIGHSQPSALPDNIKQQIKELASKAVLAIGIENSPAHVEIKITKDGPKMVELGARMGGDCITTYLLDTSVSGVNMAESAIKLALGISPDVHNYFDSGLSVGVRFIPSKNGMLKSISGVEEAEKTEGIIHLEITGKIGNYYGTATNDSDRFGFVVCKGNNIDEAQNRCLDAINKLSFIIE